MIMEPNRLKRMEKDKIVDVINKNRSHIRNIIKDSNILNKELGFSICKNDELRITNPCEGEECSIKLELCDKDKQVASFHTHTGISSRHRVLSLGDKVANIVLNIKTSCLGYQKYEDDNVAEYISCYDHPYGISKEEVRNIKDIDRTIESRINYLSIGEFGILKSEQQLSARSAPEPILRIKL